MALGQAAICFALVSEETVRYILLGLHFEWIMSLDVNHPFVFNHVLLNCWLRLKVQPGDVLEFIYYIYI